MTEDSNKQQTEASPSKLSVPFLILGIVVGHLAGLSNAEVTIPLMSGLLAFVGGSSLFFFTKVTYKDRALYGFILSFFCIGILAGVYSGFAVRAKIPVETAERIDATKLLRNDKGEFIQPFIDQFQADELKWSTERMEQMLKQLLNDYDATL